MDQIFDNALQEAGVNVDLSTKDFFEKFTRALQSISNGLPDKFYVEWQNKDRIVLFNTNTCNAKANPVVLLHCNIIEHFKEEFINGGVDVPYKYMDRTPPFIRDQTAYESDDEYTSYVKSYIEQDDLYFNEKLDFNFEQNGGDNSAVGLTGTIQDQLNERYWQWFFSNANVKKSHQQEITRLRNQHQLDIKALEEQCSLWLQKEKEIIDAEHKKELDELETLHQNNMVELQKKYDEKLQNELQQVQAIHQQTIEMLQQEKTTILQEIEELKREHESIIADMKQQHKTELENERIQFEKQREQETEALQTTQQTRIKNIEDKYKTMFEENKKKSEAELARATKDWQQKELEYTRQNKKVKDTLEKALNDWRRKEGELNQKILKLEQELNLIKETQQKRQTDYIQLEKKLEEAQSKNQMLTKENDNYLKQQNDLKQTNVDNIKKHTEDLKQNNILLQEKVQLTIKITDLEQVNQKQLKLNDEMEEKIKILEQEKVKSTINAETLLNVEKNNVLEISNKIEELTLRLQKGQDENFQQSESIKKKDEELIAQQQLIESKEKEFGERAAERDKFIKQQDDEIKQLKEDKKTNENLINATNEENQKLAKQLEEITTQNVKVLEENKTILEKQETLNNQINQLGTEKTALESQLQELKQQNDKQFDEIQKFIRASDKLNDEKRVLNEKNERLQKEIVDIKVKKEELSKKNIDLIESGVKNTEDTEQLKEKYQQSLQEKTFEIDSKEKELSELKQDFERNERKLSQLELNLSKLKQKVKQQQAENINLNTLSEENKKLADEYQKKNEALDIEFTKYKLMDITLQLENEKRSQLQQLEDSIKTYQINDDLSGFVQDPIPVKYYKKIGQTTIEKLKKHLDVYRALVLAENDKLLYTVQKFTAIPKYVYYERPVITVPTKSKIKLGKMLSLGDVITRNYYKQIATETSTGNYMISIDFYQPNKQRTHALQIKNVQARAIGVDSRHELVCHFSANKSLIGYEMVGPMGSDIVAREGLIIMRIVNEHGAVRTARYFYSVAIPETSPKFGVHCLTQLDGDDKLFVTYCSPSYIKLETLVVGLSPII